MTAQNRSEKPSSRAVRGLQVDIARRDRLTEIVSARFTAAEHDAIQAHAAGRPIAQAVRELAVKALEADPPQRRVWHWHGHGYCVMAAPGRLITIQHGCRSSPPPDCFRPPFDGPGTSAGVRALAEALLHAAAIAEQPDPDEQDVAS